MTKAVTFAFVTFIGYIFVDVYAREVYISDNRTEVVGTNNIDLRCSYVKDQEDIVILVEFLAKNVTQFEIIASFPVIDNAPASLSPFGVYLFGNITLNNTAASQKEVVIEFNNLSCKHEREYICRLRVYPYNNVAGDPVKVDSNRINIHAQVPPEKPDNITIDQEDDNNGGSVISEGENVTFTCSGDIGRPPGEYLWQKISNKTTMNYSDINTIYENIDGSCSNNGTSNLTIKMVADDNQAVIRCVELSQMDNDDKYQATDPIDVYYKVRKPILAKQPDQDVYFQTTENIVLTCHSDGHPEPLYKWFRNNSLISSEKRFVIRNVVANSSGSYVCRVNNTVEGKFYMESQSIYITIRESSVFDPDTGSTTNIIFLWIVLGCVLVAAFAFPVVIILITKQRKKRRLFQHSSPQILSNTENDSQQLPSIEIQSTDTEGEAEKQDNPNIRHELQHFSTKNLSTTENDSQQLPSIEIQSNDTDGEAEKQDNPNIRPTPRSAVYASVEKTEQCRHEKETDKNISTDNETYAWLKDGTYDELGKRRHLSEQFINDNNYDTMANVTGVQDNLEGTQEDSPDYETIAKDSALIAALPEGSKSPAASTNAPVHTSQLSIGSSQQPDVSVIFASDKKGDKTVTNNYENA